MRIVFQKMTRYNAIGENYNNTRRADPFIVKQISRLLESKNGSIYLDIGCGTGNYTIALSKTGIILQGLDPSAVMLSKAYTKNDNIVWTVGIAENLPFKDNYFSGAIATLTIHHWQNLQQGFNEAYRVLKPGSNLIVFTATAEQMQNYWLCYYFPFMMQRSVNQMPSLKSITNAVLGAGFKISSELPYFVADDLQDLFLYSGKNNPSLYLDAEVRQNISSFANLASEKELNDGINSLSEDIRSGHFKSVKEQFDINTGDYLFLKIIKP